MKHSEFVIGTEFLCGENRWRCTDVGARVIVAVCLDSVETVHADINTSLSYEQAESEKWFAGPPYAVDEIVFDEYDLPACRRVE